MPCPCPAVPSHVVLLVEPPWMPVMLWDWVTLTCQGSGTAGATTWYKDGRCWGQKGQDSFTVIQSGTYQFERPGSGLSPPVTVPNDTLVLQVPAPTLLEADTVTLRCCGPRNQPVRWVSFYRDGKELQTLRDRSLPPLQLNHSCRYHSATPTPPQPLPRDLESQFPSPISSPELFMVPVLEGSPELPEGSPLNLSCLSTPSPLRPPAPRLYRFYQDGQLVGGPQGSPQLLVPAVGVSHSGSYSCEVRSEGGVRAEEQRPARRVLISGVSLSVQPRRGQVALEDSLELSCTVAMGTGPLSFSGSREGLGAPLETSPHLELQHIGDDDSGHYQCRVSDRDSVAESVPLNVTVGSAPVTFTWLHNGHQVAQGPLLELGVIHVGHLGTYQCVATNQLGQDGHRVFRALSPELALEVTPQGTTGHLWNTGGVTRGSHVGLRSPDHR
uniref:Ig-like domain-containing protein n=1 Tax=Catharus ustulatus TaxID=91951 RepID=A0A8C3UQ26_CATUS